MRMHEHGQKFGLSTVGLLEVAMETAFVDQGLGAANLPDDLGRDCFKKWRGAKWP